MKVEWELAREMSHASEHTHHSALVLGMLVLIFKMCYSN